MPSVADDLPDEVWYKCPDCGGEGWVLPEHDEEYDFEYTSTRRHSGITCGKCDGMGRIEGDVEDMDLAKALGWERVDP